MTVSPTDTSSGTRAPSSKRPGPTARTVPSWGFSFAVSGMTRPDAVVCSASDGWTTMRSSSGLMATLVAVVTSDSLSHGFHERGAGAGACPPSRGPERLLTSPLAALVGTLTSRVPKGNLCRGWHSVNPSANPGVAARCGGSDQPGSEGAGAAGLVGVHLGVRPGQQGRDA